MKSIKNETTTKAPIPFPKLMLGGSGSVYLMTTPTAGTKVHSGSSIAWGEHQVNWCNDSFEDFHGTITLSNGGDDE